MPRSPEDGVDEGPSISQYGVIGRLIRLRDLLRNQPMSSGTILAKLADDYAPGETGRRQLRRDISNLGALGYHIERQGRPVRYVIAAASHLLLDEDIRTLRYLRSAFTDTHPLANQVQQLIDRLTQHLTDGQRRQWQRRTTLHMLLTPVIDYRGCENLLRWLDQAILDRRQIGFLYRSKRSDRWHPCLDPYDLEYTDRQFYLSAYSYEYRDILTYRLDRIVQDAQRESPKLLPSLQQPRRERKPIFFTYRLPASFADGGVSERFTIHAVQRDESHVMVKASDASEFRIIRTLLGYGEHALLLEGPPSLMERMRKTVAAMWANYFPDQLPEDSP
ncbi:MAG: WYL domain-containing protein [Chloroflexaceae bacterium]|nr:WYL domain-containing protein [Chloroflexaceae bacterium]